MWVSRWGDDDPRRSFRNKFHKLDKGRNLPLENVQTADSYKNRAQSAVPTLNQWRVSDVALADVVVFFAQEIGNSRGRIFVQANGKA